MPAFATRALGGKTRPLIEHPRALADGQPNARPMLDRRGEDLPRLIEVTTGEQHAVDLGAVLGPFLDLVEVALIRN